MAKGSSTRNTVAILGALIGGLLLGIAAAGIDAPWRDPVTRAALVVGGLWLDALKMTVIPLIVALLVTGIVGSAEAARAGGLATRSILWFVVVLSASAIFGGVMMPALLTIFPLPQSAAEALRVGLASVDAGATAGAVPSTADFLRSIIPPNVIAAAAEDKILPLVVFTAIFGFAMTRIEAKPRKALAGFFEAIAETMLVMIGWVLWVAPVGVFALAFAVSAGAGAAALGAIAHYVLLISSLGLLIVIASYGVAVIFGRVPLGVFARAMVAPQAVAISTQSSLASLPAMLTAAKEIGINETSADVTLPLAVALFRATGPAMNFGVAFYVAHWFGVEPSALQMVAAIALASVMSYSAVSLPGQISFVTSIAPIALALGVPIEPLALLVAVETIPDIFRTLGNVMMDVSVTAAVDRRFDRKAAPAHTPARPPTE
ncbi:MAG TPA: cation:dicarboxylase symporter family transporter [Sphingomicrobium sp.]|nr:cation:dicarboxylase symporter family transporter [Sphingomicrobium sp.]